MIYTFVEVRPGVRRDCKREHDLRRRGETGDETAPLVGGEYDIVWSAEPVSVFAGAALIFVSDWKAVDIDPKV